MTMTSSNRVTVKELSEEIMKLKKHHISEIELLMEKVKDLETTLHNVLKQNSINIKQTKPHFKCKRCQEKFQSEKGLNNHKASCQSQMIKCTVCTKIFSKNNELEAHIKSEHEEVEKFQCEKCDMTFVLKWRFEKHTKMHQENQNNKFCHYFNNDKKCPFSYIGCMFKHEDSVMCKYNKKCNRMLCQFKHSHSESIHSNECQKCDFRARSEEAQLIHIKEVHAEKTPQLIEEEEMFNLNVKTNFPEVFDYYLRNNKHIHCYFCDYISQSQVLKNIKDEITKHMEDNHENIIAVFKAENTEIENLTHLEFLEFFVPE